MEVLTARNLNCAKQDEHIYKRWFQHADLDGDGRITGSDATEFFSLSKLSKDDLKQAWALADSKRQGYLGFQEFVTAMQVISLAQTGNVPSADMLLHTEAENISPPTMEGLDEMLSCKETSKKSDTETTVPAQELPSLMSRLFLHSLKASKKAQQVELSHVTSVIDGLKKLYVEKLKPLEAAYQFNEFALPPLTDSDFDAKPMVLLLGQYSTGKTTFLKHVLKADYPGAHIGPEPTTDRFIVVMGGPDRRSIPGNTIAVQSTMPFTGLTRFGAAFLSKLECSQMPNSLLEHISFVDTPGVLSGEKQRTQRSYDFTGVTEWFAAKSDLILLLFDPHKLDISDEFKRVISSLRGHEDKIRVILNKADRVGTQQLMRVYGALLWSLGKILNTPEVVRIYVGSFNDQPIQELEGSIVKDLLEPEQDCLIADLKDIPRKACDRKINEFVKRARAAKIHAYLISHLRKEMPAMMGKTKAQQRLIDNLQEEFNKVQREHRFPVGDFPEVKHFKEVLATYNIDKFEKLKPKMIQAIDEMVSSDVPELIKRFRNPYET